MIQTYTHYVDVHKGTSIYRYSRKTIYTHLCFCFLYIFQLILYDSLSLTQGEYTYTPNDKHKDTKNYMYKHKNMI